MCKEYYSSRSLLNDHCILIKLLRNKLFILRLLQISATVPSRGLIHHVPFCVHTQNTGLDR